MIFLPLSSRTLNYGNPISNHPLNVGLVSRWQVLPARGKSNTLFDLAGDNHGTLTNGPTWQGAMGRPGGFGSLNFDGSNDYVAITRLMISGDFTLSFWVKATGDCILMGDSDVNNQIRIGQSANILSAYDGSNNPQSSTLGVAQTEWSFCSFSRTGSTVTFLQNGNTYGTGTLTSLQVNQIGLLLAATLPLNGSVSDVIHHNRALSATEVWALYQDTLQGSPHTLNWINSKTYFGVTAAAATQQNLMLVGCGF